MFRNTSGKSNRGTNQAHIFSFLFLLWLTYTSESSDLLSVAAAALFAWTTAA